MTPAQINNAVRQCYAFLTAVDNLTKARTESKCEHYTHPKESGALRRTSMDLTRALAEMRRPG